MLCSSAFLPLILDLNFGGTKPLGVDRKSSGIVYESAVTENDTTTMNENNDSSVTTIKTIPIVDSSSQERGPSGSTSGPRHDHSKSTDSMLSILADANDTHGKRGVKRSTTDEQDNDDDNNEHADNDLSKLSDIWNHLDKALETNENNETSSAVMCDAIDQTSQLVSKHLTELIRSALQAFHALESLSRAHSLLQDECNAKTTQIQRLQLADEKQRKTIQVLKK